MNDREVPIIVHESALARMERQLKRQFILCIILIVVLVGTNMAWIVYENQFEDKVEQTIETSTEGGGDAYGTIISGDKGEVTYGKSESDKN